MNKLLSKRGIAIMVLAALLALALATIAIDHIQLKASLEKYEDLREYMVYSYAQEHFDKGYAQGYADGAAGNRNIWG